MTKEIKLKRWTATVAYNLNDKDSHIETYNFDEINEFHDMIEAGPNFLSIIVITILPNGHVEELEERKKLG